MSFSRRTWRAPWLASLLAPAALGLASIALAGEQAPFVPEPIPHAPAGAEATARCDLATLRALALEKQPALAAYRASLDAAELKAQALRRMTLVGVIRRDIPVRREQAEHGVAAAHAQLTKAEAETLYAVTRTYYSALYARQQQKIADRALAKDDVLSLSYLRTVADEIYQNRTRPDVKKYDVDQIDVLIQVTQGRREEAKVGVERALAALREAVGVEGDCPLPIDLSAELPMPTVKVDKHQIVELAMHRRGELIQAAVGSEVTQLEIKAQGRILSLQGQTFAAGSDIHALPIPQGISNSEYRPGAVSIEMPNTLVGSRHARKDQAAALHQRANAVVDKTRHLVTLEAEDAYFKWQESSIKATEYAKAAANAEKVADAIGQAFKPNDPQGTRPDLSQMLEARVRATQLRLLANEAKYQLILALAALERVTAGGFCPGLDQPAVPTK